MKKDKKNNKYTIDVYDELDMVKNYNRKNQVMPKPMVTTDKKKKANKNTSKDWKKKNRNFS